MARKRESEKGAVELLEEAVHLLRLAPASALAAYYIGSLPFVLGFLYFWADMSRSAFAHGRVAESALVMTLLFFWMKCWQSIFASELRTHIARRSAPKWTVSRIARIFFTQAILQPSGLFVLPIALVIALPFAWAYAFYQNMTVIGGDEEGVKACLSKSTAQAKLWVQQNHLLLFILLPFGFFVFINVRAGMVIIPYLVKMFLGVETVFTQGGQALMNTTLFAAACGLAYLCVDPIVKASYALRCFYGESIHSGEDLRVALREKVRMAGAASVLLIVLGIGMGGVARAEETGGENSGAGPSSGQSAPVVSGGAQPTVSAPELNDAIERVINQREYMWRLPREEKPAEDGAVEAFMASVKKAMMKVARAIRDCLRWIINWMDEIFGGRKKASDGNEGSGSGWMTTTQLLVFVLIALVASVLVILFWRMWKQRSRTQTVVAQPVAAQPNLADENVTASQLPENEWLKLARELMEKGDVRLALRAFYLAGLAHLAEREMLSIAKSKSNREYEVELRRRARALPDLQAAFGQNVTIFDRVWYGMHEVTQEALQNFQTNLERIRAC